ncbi:substrate-binding domain-containing protein [bacterium]|nr:substrate-binding domain-containing protein [bacterium]
MSKPKVGILLSEPTEISIWGIFQQVQQSIKDAARAAEFDLIFTDFNFDFDQLQEYSVDLLNQGVSGILFNAISSEWDYYRNKQIVELFERNHVPVVLVDRYFADEPQNYSFVAIDNENGAYQTTQHLLDTGRRNIGFIRDQYSSSSGLRERGYRRAMFDAGIHVRPEWVQVAYSLGSVDRQLNQLFNSPVPPQAIICVNDLFASETYAWLSREGLEIPHDIAVTGYDDLPNAARLNPPLTTVRQQFGEIGQLAIQFLSQRMEKVTLLPQKILSGDLIIRDSSLSRNKRIIEPKNVLTLGSKSIKSANADKKIGLLCPHPDPKSAEGRYAEKTIKQIKKLTQKYGYIAQCCDAYQNRNEEYTAIKKLLNDNVKGLLFIPQAEQTLPAHEELVFLNRRETPFVLMVPTESESMPHVASDEQLAGQLAMEHLFSRGYHQPAAFLPWQDVLPAALRLTGCLQSLHSHTLSMHIHLVEEYSHKNDISFDKAYWWACTHDFEKVPIDALICGNELVAEGAFMGLTDQKIRVPDDVAIICFTDYNHQTKGLPPFTRIVAQKEKIFKESIVQLIDWIEDRGNPHQKIFPPRLIIGKTT